MFEIDYFKHTHVHNEVLLFFPPNRYSAEKIKLVPCTKINMSRFIMEYEEKLGNSWGINLSKVML